MKPRSVEPDPYSFGSRPYDLVKEFVIALTVVALLTALLAAVFSSPDRKSVTIASWSNADPADFAATATAELAGTSDTAQYGPPYNSASDGQKIGPIGLAKAAGVRHPIDTAHDFVLHPLSTIPDRPDVTQAIARWQAADPAQQQAWTDAYAKALENAPGGDPTHIPAGAYGPVSTMIPALLSQARSGGLDGTLLAEGGFYQTDYTLPLLFVADGGYLADLASADHLAGDQWGMMNETGNFPGQAWLWLYTFWYQVDPFKSSGNADALVWGLMMLLTLAFVLVPFIPGVRSIPRWIPVYRLVWRDHYRAQRARETTA